MADMDQLVKQILSGAGELHGLVDKLEAEAKEVASRAGNQKKAATEYDTLMKKLGDVQVRLDERKTELARMDSAKAALKDLASKL